MITIKHINMGHYGECKKNRETDAAYQSLSDDSDNLKVTFTLKWEWENLSSSSSFKGKLNSA